MIEFVSVWASLLGVIIGTIGAYRFLEAKRARRKSAETRAAITAELNKLESNLADIKRMIGI